MIRYCLLVLVIMPTTLFGVSFVYVSDQVEIPIRAASTSQSAFIRWVTSGEQLILLESTDEGWTKVGFDDQEGWIASKFLINDPTARTQFAQLENQYNTQQVKLTKQETTLKRLNEQLESLNQQYNDLLVERGQNESKIKHMAKTYENALAIEHSNQQLTQEILSLKAEMTLIEKNNTYEQDRSARNWFMVGGATLLAGIVLGIVVVSIVYKLGKKKRFY